MSWRRFGGHAKVRGDLWSGGTIYVGSTQDVQLEREAANRLYTPDALAVGGTAGFRDDAVFSKKMDVSSGTAVLPYGTASPAPASNGEANIYHKANVARFTMQSGGTAYTLAFPTTTNGTVTITVGSPP